MYPFTFLACTYNLWGSFDWDNRSASLERFLEVNRPDVLCIQESTQAACDLIASALPSFATIADPFPGWVDEGTIFWNPHIFDLAEYGTRDIGILEELRRLFWVRLRIPGERTIVVATAHFSWTGEREHLPEQGNVRIAQAEAAVSALDGLVTEGEPVLFMGDFNDYIHPIRVLREAGFVDSFAALGRGVVVTYPARPLLSAPPQLLDWMMHRGRIRPTLTSVVDFYVDEVPPSDHKPILTSYVVLGDSESQG
jgi:endonuclease/exonuclease/phosphatase (EEP) superfamily protein YafD